MCFCFSLPDCRLECPVCREEYTSGESVRKLPCLHFFHNECIVPWLELVRAMSGCGQWGFEAWLDLPWRFYECVTHPDFSAVMITQKHFCYQRISLVWLLLICSFLSLSQHDTCPVCRKSLDGVDNSLPPTSEPPEARSIRTEQQEKQAIWEMGQANIYFIWCFQETYFQLRPFPANRLPFN